MLSWEIPELNGNWNGKLSETGKIHKWWISIAWLPEVNKHSDVTIKHGVPEPALPWISMCFVVDWKFTKLHSFHLQIFPLNRGCHCQSLFARGIYLGVDFRIFGHILFMIVQSEADVEFTQFSDSYHIRQYDILNVNVWATRICG